MKKNQRVNFLATLLILCLLQQSPAAQPTYASNTWILAVGIDNYDDPGLYQLQYARAGAYKFLNIFERRGIIDNVEPLLPREATKNGILDALQETFVDNPDVQPSDMIIFYFSGHGTVLGQDIGAICPSDYAFGVPQSLVLYSKIQEIMSQSVARHKLCFIEACKSQVSMGGIDPEIIRRMREEQSKVAPLSVFITSTEYNKDALEDSKLGAGVFNYFLIKALEGDAYNYTNSRPNGASYEADPFLRLGEVFEFVKDNVSSKTKKKQIPQILDLGGFDPELALISTVDEMGSCANKSSRVKHIGYDLTLISEGVFWIGSTNPPSPGIRDEGPSVQIKLDCYYLGHHELTVGEFSKFVREENYVTTAERPEYGGSYIYYLDADNRLMNDFKEGISWRYDQAGNYIEIEDYDFQPVVHVSWYDAIAYCNWLSEKEALLPCYEVLPNGVVRFFPDNGGYRLPTEAEWENAAEKSKRNPLGEFWSGTSDESKLDQYANYLGNKDEYYELAPTQRFVPNYLGISDMSGNVREWCWDKYHEKAYRMLKDSEEYQEYNMVLNPDGPFAGTLPRVIRGGSWADKPIDCRAQSRAFAAPSHRDGITGFRIVKSTPRSFSP